MPDSADFSSVTEVEIAAKSEKANVKKLKMPMKWAQDFFYHISFLEHVWVTSFQGTKSFDKLILEEFFLL